jgi:antibiotic biosynthesis monooxygenase (ABM) superfamily enzyme
MDAVARGGDEEATAVILGKVKVGREADYEEWLLGIAAASRRSPGHQGITVIRPRDPRAREYIIVLRFDTTPNLERWLESPERQGWLDRARPFMEQPPQEQHTTGMEAWFTLPDVPAVRPPPKWKMWLLAWFAVFCLLLAFNAVALRTAFADLPLAARVLVSAGVLTAGMTWFAMPWLSRRLAGWLYGRDPSAKRRRSARD